MALRLPNCPRMKEQSLSRRATQLEAVRRTHRLGEGQMKKADVVTLVQFNTWANRRKLAKASRLSPPLLRGAAGLSYASPLATLVHILDTQWYWREGAQFGKLPREKLGPSDLSTLRSLRRRWDEEDHLLLAFVLSRTERQIGGTVTYTCLKPDLAQGHSGTSLCTSSTTVLSTEANLPCS
jgi:hypothetical protein